MAYLITFARHHLPSQSTTSSLSTTSSQQSESQVFTNMILFRRRRFARNCNNGNDRELTKTYKKITGQQRHIKKNQDDNQWKWIVHRSLFHHSSSSFLIPSNRVTRKHPVSCCEEVAISLSRSDRTSPTHHIRFKRI